jgi:adenine deaminase
MQKKIKKMKNSFTIKGNILDIVKREIFKGELFVVNGVIERIERNENVPDIYILPGMVDAHVHIESSMLAPQQFARIAVKHGTVATVSDPHEIANVLGIKGVDFMLEDSKNGPFKFYFGVPSCVPATSFETAGCIINSQEVDELLSRKEFLYLSEMMNFPGVINDDESVLKKIKSAKKYGKPVDGHAPGLSGDDLIKYAAAGITTDHESTSVEEAIEKIKLGIKLQIREGSAAKNFDSLIPVINVYPDSVMLCTDDCHPDDLIEKHILDLIKRGLKKGYDIFKLLRAASYNSIKHYGLKVGMLQISDSADFFVVNNLNDFTVLTTYID